VKPAVAIVVDGVRVAAEEGSTVAAALMNAGIDRFRVSVSGEPRGPLCAMGICHECRVTIGGIAQRRSCLVTVAPGMEIETGG
jgi:sarcosine oxidase subunit alpha